MRSLSVIIPTRNRAKLLEKTLLLLRQQTIDEFEIIVVDNGSTDMTKEICRMMENKFRDFIYIYEKTPGLHIGRHVGLKVSKGDILVYADDDIRAFPTWLEGIRESFEDPKVALVGGNNLPEYECQPPRWVKKLWVKTPYGRAMGQFSILNFGNKIKEIQPEYVWGCNFSIRKSVLLEIGGFHPDGMPEKLLRYRGDGETAVSKEIKRRGYKTIFNPKASVYHYVPQSRMTLEYIYKRGYMQGISDSYSDIREAGKRLSQFKSRTKLELLKLYKNIIIKKIQEPYKTYYKGYWSGYLYHQKEVSKDEKLLDWILQIDYL